jgi:hypothetical protein
VPRQLRTKENSRKAVHVHRIDEQAEEGASEQG